MTVGENLQIRLMTLLSSVVLERYKGNTITGAGHDSLVNMLHQPIKRRLFLEEPRFRSRFDMLFHSIRSSNALSLGSDKPNCILRFSANRVWLVSRLVVYMFIYFYFSTKRERSQ